MYIDTAQESARMTNNYAPNIIEPSNLSKTAIDQLTYIKLEIEQHAKQGKYVLRANFEQDVEENVILYLRSRGYIVHYPQVFGTIRSNLIEVAW